MGSVALKLLEYRKLCLMMIFNENIKGAAGKFFVLFVFIIAQLKPHDGTKSHKLMT